MIRIQKSPSVNPVLTFSSSSVLQFVEATDQVTVALCSPYAQIYFTGITFTSLPGYGNSIISTKDSAFTMNDCMYFVNVMLLTQRFTNIRIAGTNKAILELSLNNPRRVTITNITLSNIQLYEQTALGYFLETPDVNLVMNNVRVVGGGFKCMNLRIP